MNLREELMAIRAEHGALTADLVVRAATPVDSPLHDRFEWDDSIAGPKFRRMQALELIRSVRVNFTTHSGEVTSVRQWVAVADDVPQAVFQPVDEVAFDPVAKAIVLRQMKREFEQFKARYSHMAEFLEMLAQEGEQQAS